MWKEVTAVPLSATQQQRVQAVMVDLRVTVQALGLGQAVVEIANHFGTMAPVGQGGNSNSVVTNTTAAMPQALSLSHPSVAGAATLGGNVANNATNASPAIKNLTDHSKHTSSGTSINSQSTVGLRLQSSNNVSEVSQSFHAAVGRPVSHTAVRDIRRPTHKLRATSDDANASNLSDDPNSVHNMSLAAKTNQQPQQSTGSDASIPINANSAETSPPAMPPSMNHNTVASEIATSPALPMIHYNDFFASSINLSAIPIALVHPGSPLYQIGGKVYRATGPQGTIEDITVCNKSMCKKCSPAPHSASTRANATSINGLPFVHTMECIIPQHFQYHHFVPQGAQPYTSEYPKHMWRTAVCFRMGDGSDTLKEVMMCEPEYCTVCGPAFGREVE